MEQPSIELIIARSLAAHLAVPVFLANPQGRIVYFNEAAELLIGHAFEDTPELTSNDVRELLDARSEDGLPIGAEEMPLARALAARMPAVLRAVSGRDGGRGYLATAVPFLDREGQVLGALLFWYEEKR